MFVVLLLFAPDQWLYSKNNFIITVFIHVYHIIKLQVAVNKIQKWTKTQQPYYNTWGIPNSSSRAKNLSRSGSK